MDEFEIPGVFEEESKQKMAALRFAGKLAQLLKNGQKVLLTEISIGSAGRSNYLVGDNENPVAANYYRWQTPPE